LSNMEDVDLARSLFKEEKWNIVIVKRKRVLYSSRERGIAPFFQAVQSIGASLHNAALADRIMGSAVAMLCLYARITSVYAGIASQGALDMLKGQGVTVSSEEAVPYISNYDGTDLCPFEKLAKSYQGPSQFFTVLKVLFAEGNQ
jgi:hypothetical protein